MKLNTTKRMKTRYDELNKSHTFFCFFASVTYFSRLESEKRGGKEKTLLELGRALPGDTRRSTKMGQ